MHDYAKGKYVQLCEIPSMSVTHKDSNFRGVSHKSQNLLESMNFQ